MKKPEPIHYETDEEYYQSLEEWKLIKELEEFKRDGWRIIITFLLFFSAVIAIALAIVYIF